MKQNLWTPRPQINGPEVDEFVDRLRWGDATLNWAGDSRMRLVSEGDGSWTIERLDDDNVSRRVLSSKPGARLDAGVIRMIADRYQHRDRDAYDPVASVVAANKKVYADQAAAAVEAQGVAADAVFSRASSPSRNRSYIKDRP